MTNGFSKEKRSGKVNKLKKKYNFFFQEEDGIRDKLVTGFRRVLFRSLLRRVVDAGHQGRDQDPRRDAGPVELRHGLEPRSWVRRVRLGGAPRLLVQRRHRQTRGHVDRKSVG